MFYKGHWNEYVGFILTTWMIFQCVKERWIYQYTYQPTVQTYRLLTTAKIYLIYFRWIINLNISNKIFLYKVMKLWNREASLYWSHLNVKGDPVFSFPTCFLWPALHTPATCDMEKARQTFCMKISTPPLPKKSGREFFTKNVYFTSLLLTALRV